MMVCDWHVLMLHSNVREEYLVMPLFIFVYHRSVWLFLKEGSLTAAFQGCYVIEPRQRTVLRSENFQGYRWSIIWP